MTKIFGWIGTTLSLLYKIPQIYKIIKLKKIEGISISSYTVQTISYCFYLVHGYYINDNPTISLGIVSLTQNIIFHVLYYRLNKNNTDDDNQIDNETDNDNNNDIDDKNIDSKNVEIEIEKK